MSSARIFTSYRRGETAAHAGRIRDAIERGVAAKDVFIDLDTTAGKKFPDVIRETVRSAAVVVAVLGPNWLAMLHERAGRGDEIDWVRFEIERALEAGVEIVPVLVGGAVMPDRRTLPESLQPLADHQALAMSDKRWTHDSALLIGALRGALGLPNDPARAVRRRRVAIALAVCALLAGGGVAAAALIDSQPPRIDTTIESAELEPVRQTLGEFMTEHKIPMDVASREFADEEGLISTVRVRLQGSVSKEFDLHWRLYDADGDRVDGEEYDEPLGKFKPDNQDHARRASFWLAYPPRPGSYIAEFTLEDAAGQQVDV